MRRERGGIGAAWTGWWLLLLCWLEQGGSIQMSRGGGKSRAGEPPPLLCPKHDYKIISSDIYDFLCAFVLNEITFFATKARSFCAARLGSIQPRHSCPPPPPPTTPTTPTSVPGGKALTLAHMLHWLRTLLMSDSLFPSPSHPLSLSPSPFLSLFSVSLSPFLHFSPPLLTLPSTCTFPTDSFLIKPSIARPLSCSPRLCYIY